jgi:voltage-gated potassium channel
MLFRINRLIAKLRRRKEVGLSLLLAVIVVSIVGNALTFFFFDRDLQDDLDVGDALWYSIVSITTIGYGDLTPVSMGARIGTTIFIIVLGLAAFTTSVGIGVDWILDLQFKERTGMGRALAKDHLLIINYPNERRVRQIIDEFLGDPSHNGDEIVVVTDKVETLPFSLNNVHFIRGSPLEEETYVRANAREARQAIVLSTGYDDSSSDSVNASIVSILEHLSPGIRTVVESLNVEHALLFKAAKNASIVHTFQISSNLLVQEAQDPGVNELTYAITSNKIEGTLVSTRVDNAPPGALSYSDAAKSLLDHDVNLVGVLRDDEEVHVRFGDLDMLDGDRLVYVSTDRHDWPTIRSFLPQ